MKRFKYNNSGRITLFFVMLMSMTLLMCRPSQAADCPDHITAGAEFGIVAVPESADTSFRNNFCKYTEIVAPNGQPIQFFAQDQVTNDQMIRARRILEFYLEPVPGSAYGADKTAVANKMADNGAVLMLINGVDDGSNPASNLNGQPLYEGEMPTEGSAAYINNNYEFRDAAFEEILHLMHDTGIGVDGANTQPGVLLDFQANIRAATDNAALNSFQIWPRGADGSDAGTQSWYNELANENSLTQEYLASVIDSYYGFWGAFDERDGGMWGLYVAKTRDEIGTSDPMGLALMANYFNPYITYMARIDSAFDGIFTLTFDSGTPYTHKSQYLLNARLTGSNNTDLNGNAQNNQLQGNSGDNRLDGSDGIDTAIFVGNRSDYTIAENDQGGFTVTDSVAGRDGTDTLHSIEMMQFADEMVDLAIPMSVAYAPADVGNDSAILTMTAASFSGLALLTTTKKWRL